MGLDNRITVGMMLWNEAESLNRVINTVRPIADKFVLAVDSRSNDGTQEIAKEWADVYFEFNWGDDFSRVRNMVLNKAYTRWFFQMDGHEYLNDQSLQYIEEVKYLNDIDIVHIGLNIWNNEEPLLLFMVPRIFRTDKEIIYERAIHNTLTCRGGLDDYCKLRVRDDVGIMLDHKQSNTRGKMRSEQRKEISIPLIQNQAVSRDDAYDWYNLGVLKTNSQDSNGAIEAFEKALEKCNRADVAYQIKLFLAGIRKQRGERDKAKTILVSAFLDDPLRCEHIIELGALYEEDEDLERALAYYKMAIQFKIPASRMTVYLPYYSYFPYERLFKIYAKKGELINALKAGEKLKQFTFFKHKDQLESYLNDFRNKLKEANIRWDDSIPSTMVSLGF